MSSRARERTLRPGLDSLLHACSRGKSLWRPEMSGSWRRAIEVVLMFSGTVVTAMLIERRIVGALERPLSPWRLVACGLALCAGAYALRRVHAARVAAESRRAVAAPYYLPMLLIAVTGLALCVPGTSALALSCFWLLLVGTELWQLAPLWRFNAVRTESSVLRKSPPVESSDQREGAAREAAKEPHGSQQLKESAVDLVEPGNHIDAGDGDEEEAAEALPAEGVTQQMVRREQPDGRQAVSGMLRVDFAALERTVAAHLAFCPPLRGTPEFSAAAMAGPGAQVRATQILPYGVRIEIKLDVASREPVGVWVGFEACEAVEAISE